MRESRDSVVRLSNKKVIQDLETSSTRQIHFGADDYPYVFKELCCKTASGNRCFSLKYDDQIDAWFDLEIGRHPEPPPNAANPE